MESGGGRRHGKSSRDSAAQLVAPAIWAGRCHSGMVAQLSRPGWAAFSDILLRLRWASVAVRGHELERGQQHYPIFFWITEIPTRKSHLPSVKFIPPLVGGESGESAVPTVGDRGGYDRDRVPFGGKAVGLSGLAPANSAARVRR